MHQPNKFGEHPEDAWISETCRLERILYWLNVNVITEGSFPVQILS
jgi:hypothetical protein